MHPHRPKSSDGTSTRYVRSLGVIVSLALGTFACSSDGNSEGQLTLETKGRPFVLTTSVQTGDDSTGYLVPVASLDSGATFDLKDALELPESLVAARTGDPYFFTATLEDPVITRWEPKGDGAFEAKQTLSFANLGVGRSWAVDPNLFYARDRAYFTDDRNRQVVVWNPETMTLVTTIPLDVEPDGALEPWLTMTLREDRIFVVASWEEGSAGDWTRFGEHVRIIEIDPATDAVVASTDEPRCNSFTWTSTTSNGTTYFSPMSWFAPIRAMMGAEHGVASCGLRIVPPATSFDESYQVDLSALAGGRPAGTLFLVGDDVAFMRVWHEELVDELADDKSNFEDIINQAGFKWWRWQVGAEAATVVAGQEPSASEVAALFSVDGSSWVPRPAADYSTTTLDQLDSKGEIHAGLSGPGTITSLTRLQ